MPTIGEMPKGMLHIGDGKFFRYPDFIIVSNSKAQAEAELRRYMLNLEIGINFFKIDSQGSSDWLVEKNNQYIKNYENFIKVIESNLDVGCDEVEL